MQSLFAWCVSITRRTYILWLDLRAIARLLAFCSIDLWFSNMPMAISGARRAGQAGGSLPSYDQPQGLGRVCVCPHPRPEGEESRPYARLRVRSPAPRRFRVGLCPAGWSSQRYRAHHRFDADADLELLEGWKRQPASSSADVTGGSDGPRHGRASATDY